MKNATTNDNSGKPDASKVARPAWGWGRAVTPALHHSGFPQCKNLVRAKDGQPTQEAIRPSASEKHKCPQCGRGLMRRPAKDAGKHFWGCSGYPECRITFFDLDGKPNYETAKKKESK